MVKIVWLVVFGVGLLLPIGCQRTQPQRPSNRSVAEVDSTELARLYFTQRMAEEANTALAQFVGQLDSAYVLDERGYWYRFVERNEQGEHLQKEQQVLVHLLVFTLQNEALFDQQMLVKVGQGSVPAAVDNILLTMAAGERVSLLVPWYQAFGAIGNEQVPAYMNVRIDLQVDNN